MFLFLLPLILSLVPITTYYVRPNGGTPQQCNGRFDVDYSVAVAPNCAFKSVPDGIAVVTFGDTLKLEKSGVYGTTPKYAFGEWALPDKGTPPTNTDADYITITTNDPSGTPAFLFNYPAEQNKITAAMAANMPTVVAEGSTPLFRIKAGAKYWRVERLNIRNNSANGWQTVVFVDTDEIKSLTQVPHHIQIQYNWFSPDEEKGEPLTTLNIARSAENGIFLTATDFSIDHNALTGFQGRFRFGNEAGKFMTSAGILIGNYAERGIIENNYIDNWTYGFFSGGSSMPDWTVTHGAQVVSCTDTTHCTLTTTSGAAVREPLAINVAGTWGSAFVSAIDGNSITLERPICRSIDGGNSCAAITTVPIAGSKVRLRGLQPNDILIRRNRFQHYPESVSLMNGELCGKGDLEVKAGTNIRFIGNVFTCTGPTITVRNQVGDFPWAALDGLTFESNLYERSNRVFTSYLTDTTPTKKSQNISWTNNLYLGLQGNPANFPGGEHSGATTGGVNVSFTHNTMAWSKAAQAGMTLSGWHGFSNFQNGGRGAMEGLVFRDNVIVLGPNFCWNAAQTGTLPMTDCWPNADVRGNVFVNADGYQASEISSWWPWVGNKTVTGYAGLFAAPNATLTVGGDYRPAPNGPLAGAASDGSAAGYNHQKLVAALGYDPLSSVSLPTPSPTPIGSPSPVASPSVSPSPTPTPLPTPTIPIPLGSTVEITSSANIREAATISSVTKFIAPAGLRGTSGQCQQDQASANLYCFVSFVDESNGYVATQFLRVVATPTPSPTPAPTPSPSPSPTPTPSACAMTIETPTLTQNGSGVLKATITSPLIKSFTVTAIAAGGQVMVSPPTTRTFSNVTGPIVAQFTLKAKKKEGFISVTGPCGSESVLVGVQ